MSANNPSQPGNAPSTDAAGKWPTSARPMTLSHFNPSDAEKQVDVIRQKKFSTTDIGPKSRANTGVTLYVHVGKTARAPRKIPRAVAAELGEEAIAFNREHRSASKDTSGAVLRIACRNGTQTFKWLGLVAKTRFTQKKGLRSERFAVVNVAFECDGSVLFPGDMISARCRNGDHIRVKLCSTDPLHGELFDARSRERTLWELYAYTPDWGFYTTQLQFSISEFLRPGNERLTPRVHGNFNAWGPHIRMNRGSPATMFTVEVMVPVHVDLVFSFILVNEDALSSSRMNREDRRNDMSEAPNYAGDASANSTEHLALDLEKMSAHLEETVSARSKKSEPPAQDKDPVHKSVEAHTAPDLPRLSLKNIAPREEVVSTLHERVRTTEGRALNIVRALHPENDWRNFLSDASTASEIHTYRTLTSVISSHTPRDLTTPAPWAFEGVRDLSEEELKELFEVTWEEVELYDLLDGDTGTEDEIKNLIKTLFPLWHRVFAHMAALSGSNMRFMDLLNFQEFCRRSNLESKPLTRNKIQLLFKRINVEEQMQEELDPVTGETRVVRVILDDPDNPDNQLTKGEFLESLVRIAHARFPDAGFVSAVRKMLQEHVCPFAEELLTSDKVRANLLLPECHQVYNRFGLKLHQLFNTLTKRVVKMRQDAFLAMFSRAPKGTLVDKQLPIRAVMQAFALSQEISVPKSKRNNPNNQTQQECDTLVMIYPEFIEAIARCALTKFSPSSSAPAKSTRRTGRADESQETVALSFPEMFEEMLCLILVDGYSLMRRPQKK